MRRALRAAGRQEGRTHPNPTVGAIVFRGDRVLGTGATRAVGGAHAEVVALASARRRHGARALRGAAVAVTLEPCHHQGRTGPCTAALREAGVTRVLVGLRDPNPAVAGRGLRALRRAGIEVRTGVLAEECAWWHRGFASVQERGRPWVELKLAATFDGRLATRSGESQWITGEAARAHVHRQRRRAEAILVGSGTARQDDPSLTARDGERRVHCPVRVLVDSRLRVPATRRLFTDGDASRTWVLTAPRPPAARRAAREAHGAELVEVAMRRGQLDLRKALEALAWKGLTRVLVEGGGGLAAALLRAGLVDELHWYAAPSFLGSDARPAIAELGIGRLAERPGFTTREVRRLGDDLYVHGVHAEAPLAPRPTRGRS